MTSARIALLANPESGSGGAEDAARCLRDLGHDVARFSLDQVREAITAKPERIAVAGGDGSIGCAAQAAGRLGVPLGVIPVGTANDFARAMGIPGELEPACRLAAEGSRLLALELASLGERPFVNVASAGMPPLAARKAHGLKRRLGPLAYAVGAFRAGLRARPMRCRVSVDGSHLFDGNAWQVSVACSGAFGAGSEVEADPADGRLDVVVVEAGARAKLVSLAYGLRVGTIEDHDGVLSRRGREASVRTDGSSGFNVDGEIVSDAEARFTVVPDAYRLVVG